MHLKLGGGVWRKLTDAEVSHFLKSRPSIGDATRSALLSRRSLIGLDVAGCQDPSLIGFVALPGLRCTPTKTRDLLTNSESLPPCFPDPPVTLELPQKAAGNPEAGVAFMMAANLLCRIFTKLYLLAPTSRSAQMPGRSRPCRSLSFLYRIPGKGACYGWNASPGDIAVGVSAVTSSPAAHARRPFSFGGWDAALEIELTGNQPGPLAALFSACYGTAQAFIFAAQMAGVNTGQCGPFGCRCSTTRRPPSRSSFPWKSRKIPDTHLVGVGAVGSALVYSMAHLRSISGLLNTIDDDFVDLTNLGRYILMRKADAMPQQAANAQDGPR